MRPTRREFFGVAAVALGGADLLRQDSRVPARFIGDAFERGHHWLTPDPERLHVDKTDKRRVVIVGGGVAGVVAAWRLLEAGVDDFVILELEDKAGGLARNGMIGNTIVPFGGVTMKPVGKDTSPAVTRLLELAGADRTPSFFSPRTIRVRPWDHAWYEGKVAYDGDLEALDSKRVADLPLRESMGQSEIELGQRWSLLRFGARMEDLSAAAFLKDLAGRYENGKLKCLRIPGGFSTLLAPLLPKLGERLLKARVCVLAKPEGGGALVRAVNAGDATITDYQADAVVLAVPPFIARKIAPTLRERDKDLALPEPTPWLVTAFQVSRWPEWLDPAVAVHQTADETATMILSAGTPPDGIVVVHRPFPAAATTPARMMLRDMDAEDARDWSLREMAPVFPDLARVTKRVELWRVGHGAIRPAPGYATKIAPRIRRPLGPIHPCGADWAGIPCVEAAIEDGVRGAEEVLSGFGKLDRSWR